MDRRAWIQRAIGVVAVVIVVWGSGLSVGAADKAAEERPEAASAGQQGAPPAGPCASLKEIHRFEQKDGKEPEWFLSVVVSPENGKRLYTTSYRPSSRDVYLRAWDVEKRALLWERCVAKNTFPSDRHFRLVISQGGHFVAFIEGGRIQIWIVKDLEHFHDAGEGKQVIIQQEILGQKRAAQSDRLFNAVQFGRGDELWVSYCGQRIKYWRPVMLPVVPKPLFGGYVAASEEKAINAYDVTCNEIYCLAWEPGEPPVRIAVAGQYARIAFWNTKTRKMERAWDIWDWRVKDPPGQSPWDGPRFVHDLVPIQAGGKRYWVSAHGSGSPPFFARGRMAEPAEARKWVPPKVGPAEGFVQIWNEAGEKLHRCPHNGAVLAVAYRNPHWALSEKLRKEQDTPWFVTAEFCKVCQYVKRGQNDPETVRGWYDYLDLPSRVYIWDVRGRKLAVGEGHSMGITGVAVSPDGRWLASCSVDGSVRLWEVPPLP